MNVVFLLLVPLLRSSLGGAGLLGSFITVLNLETGRFLETLLFPLPVLAFLLVLLLNPLSSWHLHLNLGAPSLPVPFFKQSLCSCLVDGVPVLCHFLLNSFSRIVI